MEFVFFAPAQALDEVFLDGFAVNQTGVALVLADPFDLNQDNRADVALGCIVEFSGDFSQYLALDLGLAEAILPRD